MPLMDRFQASELVEVCLGGRNWSLSCFVLHVLVVERKGCVVKIMLEVLLGV